VKKNRTALSQVVVSDPFESAVSLALVAISAAENTRMEYRRDFELWRTFCQKYHIRIDLPREGAVAAFVEWMRERGDAPRSRARRMSALCSIYRELKRKNQKLVPANPFSVDDGPKREKVSTETPTPLARPDLVLAALKTCDDSLTGIRDAAIIRVLWSTGMRRASLLSMTHKKLQRDRRGIIATVIKKGGEDHRVLIRGKALEAFERWLQVLKDGSFTTGEIWRDQKGRPLNARDLNRMLQRRGGKENALSPHMLRVAFITYNPAPVEAKQDAAGHANIETTMLYDRRQWKGLEAFEKMPEVEDVEE